MSSDLESKVQGNLVKDQTIIKNQKMQNELEQKGYGETTTGIYGCLLYTSPSPRDLSTSRMPSSA